MKTRQPIAMKVLGNGTGEITIPAGVKCDPAKNLPGRYYWARGWKGMNRDARQLKNSIGILLHADEIAGENK